MNSDSARVTRQESYGNGRSPKVVGREHVVKSPDKPDWEEDVIDYVDLMECGTS
jgi:hypothetical protein